LFDCTAKRGDGPKDVSFPSPAAMPANKLEETARAGLQTEMRTCSGQLLGIHSSLRHNEEGDGLCRELSGNRACASRCRWRHGYVRLRNKSRQMRAAIEKHLGQAPCDHILKRDGICEIAIRLIDDHDRDSIILCAERAVDRELLLISAG
jgi:hypothetical protein